MENLINAFLSYERIEKGLAENTIMAYGRDLTKFLAFLSKQKRALADIRRDDIVDFLASLYRQKLDSRSVARHLVTVRNFFRFAVAEGAVPADPTLTLESPKIRRSLPGYLVRRSGFSSSRTSAPHSEYATRPCSRCCTPPACGFRSWSACALEIWR